MKTLARNKKAGRDFHILETFEAGIALEGTEVKSCRRSDMSLEDGYAVIKNNEVWLHGVHIAPYEHGNIMNHEPRRPRRLLLKKREIRRIRQQTDVRGKTLIPLRCYLKGGLIKLELALASGKTKGDKRETLKRKTAEEELKRAMGR